MANEILQNRSLRHQQQQQQATVPISTSQPLLATSLTNVQPAAALFQPAQTSNHRTHSANENEMMWD
jgi:hypothetical protein